MGALREFDASSNELVGSLPPALAGLATLRLLDLSGNALDGMGHLVSRVPPLFSRST